MADVAGESSGRVKGTSFVKPIVYGNVARNFGKKREEDNHTHQWTVYVKAYKNEDMSQYVKKVQFKLHESYANATRVVSCPPYEVSETGWGEFEVIIKIYFHDPNEKPVTFYHILKLFDKDPLIMAGKKPLVCEYYDELIFNEPSLMMYQVLSRPKQLTSGSYRHETDFEEKKAFTLESILNAKEQIKNEITEMKESLKSAKDLIQHFKAEITKAQEAEPVATETLT